MRTYDIIISHHEQIRAVSEENARDKFYLSLEQNNELPNTFLDSLLKISCQMTFQEVIENRMQFGADERKTALGRKFALRTIESINRSASSLTERSRHAQALDMTRESLDKWLASQKPKDNWIDRRFAEFDLEGEVNNSASEEELSLFP